MTDTQLEQLHRQLENKRDERLQEIERHCQSQIAVIELQINQETAQIQKKLKQDQLRKLAQLKSRAQREVDHSIQQRIWAFERSCIAMIESDCRKFLMKQLPNEPSLLTWVQEATNRLQLITETDTAEVIKTKNQLSLKVNNHWFNALQSMKTTSMVQLQESQETQLILGGAILADPDKHIEIDGSWEQRLNKLLPKLWQRWYQRVGSN